MARTALLCLLPAMLIATGWRQLEAPAQGRQFAFVAFLAVVAALLPRRLLQLGASIGALLVAVHLAFGLRPMRGIFSEFASGLVDFYEVTVPFDAGEHERMHGVLLLAVFAFVLGASLAIAHRRAILAAGLTFAGAAWPVTLIRDAPTASRGTLLLVTALILLAALRPGPRTGLRQTALVGSGLVVAALIAVSSPAVAKGGFLNWERWEPYTRPENPVDVSYVWNANYRGIRFPKKSTTVLTIKAPPRAPYWRATTLDVFVGDHWREDAFEIQPVEIGGRDALVDDPLVPPSAWQQQNWMQQEVTVRALRDTHLIGATMPIAFERGAANSYTPGVAHVGSLRRGDKYEVWSYVRRPTPGRLAASKPDYPSDVAGGAFLETPSGFAAAFGTPGREALMRDLLRRGFGDRRYRRLYETALQVVGRPRNPYAAVIALENWFRTDPSFTYDETPPRSRVPPLVAFVTDHRRGYCQHFAGAMALMLRYLGIPARVGAGFTTGRYDLSDREYTVSDTNAHTWVEVWFRGYGWLPFDPTPGRGRLLSSYTSSSTFFDANGATNALEGVAATALGLEALRSRLDEAQAGNEQAQGGDSAARPGDNARDGSDGGFRDSLLGLLLLVAAVVVSGLWTLKTLRRQVRYFTRDPRRLAGAVRLDLVDYLVDQRLPVSASATPAEVGVEIERSLGVMGERFADALAEARYGPDAQAAAAVDRARNEVRAVRRAIRRRLGTRDRLRGLLSLRSLGLGAG